MDALNWGLVPLLLLFPDGRPPSPRWRPVVWVAVAACLVATVSAAVAPGPMDDGTPNPIRWLHGAPGEVARTLALGLWRPTLLLMAVGALSLLARYRRADGRQRQQIKWLA
jgi:H+/Cl- antiporter ClcA